MWLKFWCIEPLYSYSEIFLHGVMQISDGDYKCPYSTWAPMTIETRYVEHGRHQIHCSLQTLLEVGSLDTPGLLGPNGSPGPSIPLEVI